MMAGNRAKKRVTWGRLLLLLVAFLLLGALLWLRLVVAQIESVANHDEAASADAIAVFGAAEYDGKPSPVLKARLDHAVQLYRHGLAGLIVTLGGDGGDSYSEGGVGRDYLMGQGIPESDIIAETESRSTVESVDQLAVIARANGLHRVVLVSDGEHLFRIRELCRKEGLNVLTSPRSKVPVEGDTRPIRRLLHEVLSYTAWRMGLQ